MLDVGADLSGLMGPVVVGLLLVVGAWSAVRTADQRPPRGRHRPHRHGAAAAHAPERRKRPRPAIPAPVAGGAAGLLESIPFLEPVRRRRLRGTARLGSTLVLAAGFVAAVLYMIGRTLVNWLNSFQP